MTVVYIDSVFLFNMLTDYLMLLCAAHLAGIQLRRGRFLLAAAAGGAYAVAVFLPGCAFLTALPIKAAAGALVALIAYGGERMGVFYAEKGASQRPSKIVYDRKYTSIATCAYEDFDWEDIFAGATHFHMTGITPALSKSIPSVCIKACRKAKEMGLTVSCDLNYRKNLWTEAEANACMVQLMPYIDVLVANEEDAEKVLGIKARDTDVTQGKLNREGYIDVAEQICQTYGTKMVAVTLRRSISASDNEWSAMLYTNGKPYFSKQYMIHLVDRVGGGDSFTAGLLYGIMNDYGPQETIEYAAAASCLKQTIELDFNLSTADEVERLVGGDGSGRVQR